MGFPHGSKFGSWRLFAMPTPTSPVLAAVEPALRNSTTPVGVTPNYLLPAMGEAPVTEPVIYRSLFILDSIKGSAAPAASTLKVLDSPIDPFDDKKLGAEAQRYPAVGVI